MGMEMEEKNYDRVYATVDLDAIRENCNNMKQNLHRDTRMIGVIKTDGYGHGAIPIAHELEHLDYFYGFATATVEEALLLRKAGIKKPLLILGYTFPYCYDGLINEEIRPAVFRMDQAKELSESAESLEKKCKIHIKVDTGMSRIGIRPDDSGIAFVKEVLELPNIEVEGIFTHFARADELDKGAALKQMGIFQTFTQRIKEESGYEIPIKHCSNSAGIIELQDANMDVVRAGITLYGMWPSPEVKRDIVPLKAALSLYTHMVYIKDLEPGREISYGGTFVVNAPMKVATIPIGYGDGYPRGLSNKGYVLIHGKKAPILGRVCMDQFMVDVTAIPEAREGELVTLIGSDGDEIITIEELGALSGRFNYELACDLGKRIPRVYLKGGKIIGTKDYFEDL
ncbi:MAG: alanine racemase [Lachnospiraceae bacterium]|nr:alanine racemase [Lachnospiraceae bacterium]